MAVQTSRLEKRRHSRVDVRHLHVVFRRAGLLGALLSPEFRGRAMAMDLSEGGMRLVLGYRLAEALRLSFRLQGSALTRTVALAGRVTRCRQIRDNLKGGAGHLYEVGVVFTRAGQDYLGVLRGYRRDPLLSQGF